MSLTTERCSVLSQQRGEPMLGTAFAQRGVLLVEQPGPWGHGGLTESRLDPDVAATLQQRADAADLRLLAIRRPGRTPAGITRRWAIRTAPGEPLRWSEFGRDADLLDVPLDGSAGETDAAASYFVCAHSKRDLCCAVRGRPIAAALDALVPGRVWECSHTGGHRFAPIVLALPVGALYGRITGDVLPALLTATERAAVLPELLRGVIGLPPVAQAAVAHAMVKLGLDRPDAVRIRSTHEAGPGLVRVCVTAAGRDYDVILSAQQVPTPYPSCGKPEPKPELQLRLVDFGPA